MEGVTSFYIITDIQANFVLRRVTDGIPAPTCFEICKISSKFSRNFHATWNQNKAALEFPTQFLLRKNEIRLFSKNCELAIIASV